MCECINIPLMLLSDKRLSLNDVRVYAILVQCADGKRKCSPTREEIQCISGVQRVSRHTKNLSHFGFIRIEKGGNGNRNTYTLLAGLEQEKASPVKTLTELQRDFLEYSAGVHSSTTLRTYGSAFRELVRVEGDRRLSSIGVREVEHFLSVKKVEASEWTSRKYYIALSSAFEKAVQWGYLTDNPFRKVARPKVREILPAYFSERDFRLLLSVIGEKDFRELCIVGLLTGLRLGELLSLKWSDIDFTSKVILVRNSETFTTKTRRNRAVPMSEELCRLLRERRESVRSERENIFCSQEGKQLSPGTVSQKFKRYVRRARLNDRLHFHSLRHSFASALVVSGVSLYAVQKLLGHTSSKTTEVYSHLSPQQLHGEVNTLASLFTTRGVNTN